MTFATASAATRAGLAAFPIRRSVPMGSYLLFSASAAGQANLYLYSLDEEAGGRGGRGGGGGRGGEGVPGAPVDDHPGAKIAPRFSPDSTRSLLSGSRARAIHRRSTIARLAR